MLMHPPKRFYSFVLAFTILFASLISIGLKHTIAEDETVEPEASGHSIVLETEDIDPKLLHVPYLGEIDPAKKEQINVLDEQDPNEIVCVSIFLEGKSTIDAGYSMKGIARNTHAIEYRRALELQQKMMQTKIEGAVGHELDVQWNLTLLTNAISVRIPFKDISVIEALPGVKSVERENTYQVEPEPEAASDEDTANTRTAGTAENMVGAKAAWEAGYTGAGTRIAIIDTGIDDTHQSFSEDALLHAIEEVRASGKTVELMEQIDDATLSQLNAKKRLSSLTAAQTYRSLKIPFAFNYADKSTTTDHLHDTQGNHGSHVAGIAAANRYIKNGDSYEEAFSAVQAVGMAPDAQLIVMKTLGNVSAGESAVFAAIEDALILDCDAINISLLGIKPGFSYASDSYQKILNRLVNSESADTVVSVCAGNSSSVSVNLYLEDVSQHTGSSPGTYINSLCVASSVSHTAREKATVSNGSSWGVPGSLLMKPEITAPGDSIYSVLGMYFKNGDVQGEPNQYGNMSGTSMAAPHIAGLSAIIAQYLRENPIKNDALTRQYSTRAIIQSLLLSTATPMKSAGKYISLLQQGAGLAEVSKAIGASSVVMMDDAYLTTATQANKDGKVKVELGDDPEKNGEYTYTFDLYNVTDYPLAYTFHTDLFTQAISSGKYLGKNTTGLQAAVSHTLTTDGGASAEGHDVDRDGDTDNADVQAILDYLTGSANEATLDLSAADIDGDGAVTSYDAHLLIDWTPEGNESLPENTVPAHGKAKVTVHIQLNDTKLNNYPNGAYIQGFTYVTCNSVIEDGTEEIDLSHEHTIPIIGFYGDWTDSSMFDCVTYIDQLYGTNKTPYSKNYETNCLKLVQNGSLVKFSGNPYIVEESFPISRLAINSETCLDSIDYMLLRTAGTVGLGGGQIDSENNEYVGVFQYMMLHDQNYNGMVGMVPIMFASQYGTARSRVIGRTPESYGVEEGDRFRIGIYAFPEYTGMQQNSDLTDSQAGYLSSTFFSKFVKSGEFGKGSFFGYDFTIDDTSPTIGEVRLEGNTLHIDASDNQNVAYVALRSLNGEIVYAEDAPGTSQATVELDATTAIDAGETAVILFVGDYAGNEAAVSAQIAGSRKSEEENRQKSLEADPISIKADHAPEARKLSEAVHANAGNPTVLVSSETRTVEGTSETTDQTTFILSETQATTNGMFTVTYDPQKLTFAEANGIEAYSSVNADETTGIITIAYAAKQALAAGATVATIRFTAAGCTDESLTVTTTERGRDFALHEVETVIVTGSGHLWGTPTYTWSSDNRTVTAKAVCRNNAAHTVVETVNTASSITTPATCTTKGKTTYTATFTNTLFTTQTKTVQDIPALGHDLEHHVAKAPTCTEIGWNAYDTCTRCDYTTYRELAALGHDLEHHAAKAPTCTEIGWNAYDTCSRCDYTTYQELPAIGHSYGTPTYTWSSDNRTVTAKVVCRNNSAHTIVETVNTTSRETTPATCTTKGKTTYTATFTNALFTAQTRTVQDIPALGHDLEHHAAKAPTCTEIGWNAYDTCSRCDYTTYQALPALGHDLEHHAAKAPTCTEIGWNAYDTCTRCDYTTYQTLPALGHDLEHHAAKAPTCTEIGWNAYDTCTRCDYTTYQELPAIGHSYGTPTYTWSSDNRTVTAKAVCRHDASHVKNETVQTTETVTQEAAPGVPGVKTYTAEFTDALFATQTKTEEIPALPVSASKPATVEVKAADVEFNGKTPYRVYNGKAQTPGYIVKDEKGNVIPASKYKAEYKENVKAGTAYIFITFPNKDYKDCRTFFKIYLPATTWTKVENVENGIKISWTKVEGAAGYVVYRRAWNLKDAGWTTFERWNNTTGTSWVDTKVYAGTRYQYGVKAYFARRADAVTGAMIGGNVGDNYNLGLVGPLKTTVRITTRVLNSVTPGSKKLTVKWTGSSLFTGYQVQVATDAKFTQNVQTVTVDKAGTYEKAVTGLKAKTTYYVRVRSYHIFEGMTYYGQWSNVLNGTTK